MPQTFVACVQASDGIVVDVGANTGFYSILAALAKPSTRVVALEPYPPVLHELRRNLHLNGLGRRVKIVEKAIGAETGTALFVPTDEHGLVETSCTLSDTFKPRYSASLDVAVATLDDVCAERRVAVVKIDVESLEHAVLAGGVRTLRRWRPLTFVEVLPPGNLPELRRLYRELDYVDVQLHPTKAIVGRDVEFAPTAWNHLWVPRERLDVGRAIPRAARLPVESVSAE